MMMMNLVVVVLLLLSSTATAATTAIDQEQLKRNPEEDVEEQMLLQGDPYDEGPETPDELDARDEIHTLKDLNYLLKEIKSEDYHVDQWIGLGGGMVLGVFRVHEETRKKNKEEEEEGEKKNSHYVVDRFLEAGHSIIRGLGTKFVYSVSDEIADHFALAKTDGAWKIFVYPDPKFVNEEFGELPRYRYPGSETYLNFETLSRFIEAKHLPTITRLTDASYVSIMKSLDPIIFLVSRRTLDFKNEPKAMEYLKNRLSRVVKAVNMVSNQARKFRYVISDVDNMVDEVALSLFPTKTKLLKNDSSWERRLLIKDGIKYYAQENDFTVDQGIEFLKMFLNHELSNVKIFNPEEISEAALSEEESANPSQDSLENPRVSAIESVSKKQLEKLLEETEDMAAIFVIFYTSTTWCGDCKKLMPVIEKLARDFATNEHIIFARTEEQLLPYFPKIEEYPSLFLVPKGRGKPIEYSESSRDYESLKTFIVKHL